MASLTEPTTILTQSQKHWRAWVKALQTRDASVRAEALDQLSKFLTYWTTDLYLPTPITGFLNGQDTPQPESWDEVFNVDADLLIRSKRAAQARLDSNEAWLGPYGLDEFSLESHHIEKPLTMNPWDNSDGSKETRENLSRYYCEIQRLVVDCPFADVRRTCRKLLDKARRKNVEIPSLVNDGPSWVIPISEIIGFKTGNHIESITISIPEQYVSDNSSSESDIEFRSKPPDYDDSLEGYGYYTSPDATPRPTFSTPVIPIKAPPRSRTGTHHRISRNTSQESLLQPTTSSHKSAERKYPRQPHASGEIREFQIASFVTHGRVTNYAKVLFFMPRYLRCSSACHEKLIGSMKGISRPNKTFIALLAAAEKGCQYFVSYFAANFLEIGGDSVWLKGIKNTPGYMQRIAVLNRKLVQEPWALTEKDITALTETREIDGHDVGWNLSEVIQIITILAMFHCQSSVALGVGVVCEADVFGGTIWRRIPRSMDSEDTVSMELEDHVSGGRKRCGLSMTLQDERQEIIDKLRDQMLPSGYLSPDMSFDNLHGLHRKSPRNGNGIDSRVELMFRQVLENDQHKNGLEPPASTPAVHSPFHSATTSRPKAPQTESESPINPVIEELCRYTIDGPSESTIFPSNIPPKRFCWYETMQILQHNLPDLATNLDKRFHLPPTRKFLQPNLQNPIDVTPFKEALHYHSLALLGIIEDTYNYKLINEFLGDELRAFVRLISLDPRGLTKRDWEAVKGAGFTCAEIVEICTMVSEARFMGVLMYAYKIIGSLQGSSIIG